MAYLGIVVSENSGTLKVEHFGPDVDSAQAAFEKLRHDGQHEGLYLIQNPAHRIFCNPKQEKQFRDQEAQAAAKAAQELADKDKIEAKARLEAAKKELEEAEAQLAKFDPKKPVAKSK